MADAPAKPGLVGSLKRKAGPLPVWAWSAIVLAVGYYLYRRYENSQSTSADNTPTYTDATAVPTSDQAGGGLGSGGAGTNANEADLLSQLDKIERMLAKVAKEDKGRAVSHKPRHRTKPPKTHTKGHTAHVTPAREKAVTRVIRNSFGSQVLHPHNKSRPIHTKGSRR